MKRERDRERMVGLAENAPDMQNKRRAQDEGGKDEAGEREESPPSRAERVRCVLSP